MKEVKARVLEMIFYIFLGANWIDERSNLKISKGMIFIDELMLKDN